jgi:simple sugar transport system permease protein
MIQDTARLTKLAPHSQLTTAIFIAIFIAILLQVLIKRTALGYEMQVTGFNLKGAKTAGISVAKIYLFTFALSGAIAGLCGSTLVMGVNGRFVEGISTKYGFGGISVAALAAYNPVAVIFSAILFGILKAGAITLNRTTAIPIEFVDVIQVVVIVYVAAPRLIQAILSLKNKVPNSRKKTVTPQNGANENEVK